MGERKETTIKQKENPIGSTQRNGASLKPLSRKTQWEKSKERIKECMTQELHLKAVVRKRHYVSVYQGVDFIGELAPPHALLSIGGKVC